MIKVIECMADFYKRTIKICFAKCHRYCEGHIGILNEISFIAKNLVGLMQKGHTSYFLKHNEITLNYNFEKYASEGLSI